MKKLSDRLQALIADGEIPLSDAWGKLIDDLKATEQQKPVYIDKEGYEAITDILDRRISGAGRYVSLSSHSGEPIEKRYPIYLFQQMPAENNDREMLKRLAVIMSGSDSGGEIAALTVTAQSFVDRCKMLAKERELGTEFPPVLPCPVFLEPGLRFGKGVATRVMLAALQRREKLNAMLEAMTTEERADHDANVEAVKAMLSKPEAECPTCEDDPKTCCPTCQRLFANHQ